MSEAQREEKQEEEEEQQQQIPHHRRTITPTSVISITNDDDNDEDVAELLFINNAQDRNVRRKVELAERTFHDECSTSKCVEENLDLCRYCDT